MCQCRVAGEAVGGRWAHTGAGHGLFQPFLFPAAAEKARAGLGSISPGQLHPQRSVCGTLRAELLSEAPVGANHVCVVLRQGCLLQQLSEVFPASLPPASSAAHFSSIAHDITAADLQQAPTATIPSAPKVTAEVHTAPSLTSLPQSPAYQSPPTVVHRGVSQGPP